MRFRNLSQRLGLLYLIVLGGWQCTLVVEDPVANEADLRRALRAKTGFVQLAAGVIEISSELEIPAEARDLEIRGAPSGTVLRASDEFQGRALLFLRSAEEIRLTQFSIHGNREMLERPVDLPPSNVAFSEFYRSNGIVAEGVASLTISGLHFSDVTNYAIIVNHGSDLLIENVQIKNSGSRDADGRNNASGGILLEEGTSDFVVRDSTFENIRGNGVWTHSRYTSPRNRNGLIAGNRFVNIARDAIQVGHATRVKVERNSGEKIGYPIADVNMEAGAMPVAIDTAGNTDESVYADNRFEEINGKCIDLDGFHRGSVRGNTCVNRGPPEQYPSGHFGIVMNNANPDMESEQILIVNNEIDGMVYGGIFVIGSEHKIIGNRLRNLNRARCTDESADPRCHFWPHEPALLRSGIYLGSRAERPATTRNNVIKENEISGFGMASECIAASPGIDPAANQIDANRCSNEPLGN